MKKVLSFICALSMVSTMFVGLATTASAAVTKPTITAEYVDLSANDTAKYHYAGLKLTLEMPQTFSAPTSEWDDNDDEIFSGLTLSGFSVGLDLGELYSPTSKGRDLTTEIALNVEADGTISFTPANQGARWSGASKIELGTVAYRTSIESTPTVVAVKPAKADNTAASVTVYSGVNQQKTDTTFYTAADVDFIADEIPAYPAAEEDPKVTTVAAWAFDGGMLVIGKLDGEFEVGTYGVEVPELGTLATGSYAGTGPKFPTRNPASDAGYYGVQFTAMDAGTYTASAYTSVGNAEAKTVTVTVAE